MRKRIVFFVFIFLFSIASSFAQEFEDFNRDLINSPESFQEGQIPPSLLADLTQPLQTTIQPLIDLAKYIIGGFFGLYLLLVILRVYYERKKVNLLKDIRYDLDHLNKHFGVSHSVHRKGFFARLWAKLRGGS
ncbi:hypothetical protein HY496_00505 [Candidatus Woesearchaeota archaeon]|nr:hypothetical protein [Candidatus Woesearchaeota archaeon]